VTYRGVKAASAQFQGLSGKDARQALSALEPRREAGRAHGVMLKLAVISGLAVAMALSACAGPGPKPDTAVQLAHEITGCAQFFRQPPGSYAMQDVVCPLPDYALVEITTFKTARDEHQWLADSPAVKCPRPVVEGRLWVAQIVRGPVIKSDIFLISSSIGGRVVVPDVGNVPLSCSAWN
jgi:hypothetical protein